MPTPSIIEPYAGLYESLEVHPRARPEVIQAAYQALSKLIPATTKDGKALRKAHEVLSDADKRADYDASRAPSKGTIIGNYRVLELIAEGGFGRTYLGEQTLIGEAVCIKHCSNISAIHDAILMQEARAMWDLRHFAIPAMRDITRLDDGSLALVMSYIPGPTLEQVCAKVGRLDPETVAWITERILNALLYLHHHGVIHGDIKPQNVIVQTATHSVVLLDFGLSMSKPTPSSKALGYTPHFAPPEQMEGKTLLPASDFYSLGKLMLYILSGGLEAVKTVKVPSDVPDPLCEFIQRLIEPDIRKRPQGDLFDEFKEVRQKAFGRNRSGMRPIVGL